MATNFPGSQDTFTNPTSGSSLSSPSHADQHTNVNDAIEAIETALLDGAPLKIDDANQRVGIGTTSPSTALEVSSNTGGGTTSTDLRISSTGQSSTWSTSNAWGVLDFYNADGSGGGAKSHVSLQAVAGEPLGQYSDLQFHVTDGSASDITAMTIEGSSGNVGIGDTTPSYKLDVNGDINSTGAIRKSGISLGVDHGWALRMASADSFTLSTSYNAIAFADEQIDTDGYHSTSTNNTRVTIPTGLGGVYSIVMHMSTSHSTAPTYVELYARVNNGGVQRVKVLQGVYRPGSYWGSFGSVSGMLRLDDGDYVEMLVRINGGSSVAPLGTSTSYYPTVFAGARVGT